MDALTVVSIYLRPWQWPGISVVWRNGNSVVSKSLFLFYRNSFGMVGIGFYPYCNFADNRMSFYFDRFRNTTCIREWFCCLRNWYRDCMQMHNRSPLYLLRRFYSRCTETLYIQATEKKVWNISNYNREQKIKRFEKLRIMKSKEFWKAKKIYVILKI